MQNSGDSKQITVDTVFEETFRIWKKLCIPMFLLYVLQFLPMLSVIIFPDFFVVDGQIGAAGKLLLFFIVLQSFGLAGTTVSAASNLFEGKPLNLLGALKVGYRNFSRILGAYCIFVLAFVCMIMLCLFFVIAASHLLAWVFQVNLPSINRNYGVLLLMCILTPIAITMFISSMLMIPALINEKLSIIASWRRSNELLKKSYWRTFGYSVVLLIIFGLSQLADLFIGKLAGLEGLSIFGLFFASLTPTFNTVLYCQRRRLLEGASEPVQIDTARPIPCDGYCGPTY